MRAATILASIVLPLCGCVATPPACLLPSQKPMLAIDMFFGRDIPGRAPVSEAMWAAFARAEITPRFPDGFTVIDARGQWLDPETNSIGAEASKMVRIDVAPGADVAARVAAVADAYKARFHQMAVGVSSAAVCAAF